MVATRERPDVPVKMGQKFDDYGIRRRGYEIALRHFQFIALQRACSGEQLISRASSEHQKVRGFPFAVNAIARLVATSLHRNDVRLPHGASCFARAIEQQTIQDFARIDHNWVLHFERRALIVARDQLNRTNQLLWMGVVQQEGVSLRRLVCEPAAAWLFPRKMLIKNHNFVPRAPTAGRTSHPKVLRQQSLPWAWVDLCLS